MLLEDGGVDVAYAGGAVSWTSTLAGGDSTLGQFLSGSYAVHLDASLLDLWGRQSLLSGKA